VVRTDDNGIFTFTCPRTGWWGFAALLEGDKTVKGPDGKEKDMEMGAVLWTYMDNSSDAKQ
jgi:cobalt/nickel transport protein